MQKPCGYQSTEAEKKSTLTVIVFTKEGRKKMDQVCILVKKPSLLAMQKTNFLPTSVTCETTQTSSQVAEQMKLTLSSLKKRNKRCTSNAKKQN